MKMTDYLLPNYVDPDTLHEKYFSNSPFPHIVLDNFINESLLNQVESEFPDLSSLQNQIKHNTQKQIKFSSIGSKDLSPSARDLVSFLNSDLFLQYLQKLTGIEEVLISDPYLSGGGYHEIKKGGLLKVHADFNKHPKLDLDRRINLLLYLNKDWQEDWRGKLEFYDQENLSKPVVSVAPLFNRCVIFTTTSFTYHGHPDQLVCPDTRSRRSLALYYFSTGRPDSEISAQKHSTMFVETKSDKFTSSKKELVKEFIPPIVIRCANKILRK